MQPKGEGNFETAPIIFGYVMLSVAKHLRHVEVLRCAQNDIRCVPEGSSTVLCGKLQTGRCAQGCAKFSLSRLTYRRCILPQGHTASLPYNDNFRPPCGYCQWHNL